MRGGSIIKLLLVTAILITGCEPKPQSIELGSDQCAYCRMMITEQEFGSQVLNKQGRSFKFDSVECMAAFGLTEEQMDVHSKWVPDFLNRDTWLRADEAQYLHSETLRSPMGMYLSAYSSKEDAERMMHEYGGEVIGYDAVKEIVRKEWLSRNNHQPHNH